MFNSTLLLQEPYQDTDSDTQKTYATNRKIYEGLIFTEIGKTSKMHPQQIQNNKGKKN